MRKLTCSDVLKATGGTLVCGDEGTEIMGVSTDSRNIRSGDLFIPIKGEKFDGHDYIEKSLEVCDASLTHIDTGEISGKVIIKVDDTLKALGALAAYYKNMHKIPFVAVTGSVGKTSTKDMIASVSSMRYNTLKTSGNFNNEIGLPLTLLRLEDSHEAGIIEMGMSGFGEISRLSKIVNPDVAVITNIGMSHIEKLGSRQNILKAKLEIIEGMNSDGTLILNGDDHLLYGLKDLLKIRTVYYGMEEGHDFQAFNVESHGEKGTYFEIALGRKDFKVHVPVPGIHNVYNALAAIAVGTMLNVPDDLIVKGISQFTPGKMRLDIISKNGIKVINDAYNASPQSMEAAMQVLHDMGTGARTIAVLGDMLEMGDFAQKAHEEVGKFAVGQEINYLVTFGGESAFIASGAAKSGMTRENIYSFTDIGEIKSFLKSFIKEGDIVLVKGSRGMKMERIVEHLTEGI
ncbi:MAG TPA: UDP-N-acetylmuramoyl-tripeptide--D-alanyl-D-alanine ligase [Clostridia bacterium]